jgi:alpha-methylacyl-CoA racemase
VVIEGMRPGAMERLGFGPEDCERLNPELVYVRMTGWGQTGPYATMVGHDINYLGLTGTLGALGRPGEPPPVPLNLLGDYAGGSCFAVIGILAALLERQRSGRGQVVDAAIVDGVASLNTATFGMRRDGRWHDRGQNAFDGSRPWYRTYETSDGRYVAVGAIEPQFYAALLRGLGLDPADWPRETSADLTRLGDVLEKTFRSGTRLHWTEIFDGTDACVTPVLSLDEAPAHPHNRARTVFTDDQPMPAPRLSRTPAAMAPEPAPVGRDTDAVLAELGYDAEQIAALRDEGVVA